MESGRPGVKWGEGLQELQGFVELSSDADVSWPPSVIVTHPQERGG